MSYDYLLFKFKSPVASAKEITKTNCDDMGTLDELRATIARVFPNIKWVDPEIGRVETHGTWCEFWLGPVEPPILNVQLRTSFHSIEKSMVHEICQATGWRAMDMQTGNLVET